MWPKSWWLSKTEPVMSKVVWITGAGKGIGQSLAIELAAQGWLVAATSRSVDDLKSLESISKKLLGQIISYPGDVTESDEMDQVVQQIETDNGPISLAIFNAGNYIRFGVEKFSLKDFKRQVDINLFGTINCLSPVLLRMRSRRSGHLVVMSSLSSYRGLPHASAYGASKAALTNMCESLKVDLEDFRIKITLVNPGFVDTPLTEKNKFPMPFLVSSEYAAHQIIKGIKNHRFEVTFPSRLTWVLKLMRILPYSIYFHILRKLK